MPIQAVIFDYGMVLCHPADPAAHQQLVEIFGAPPEDFERQYWAHRHAYDEGKFDGPGFWHRCAEKLGLTLTAQQIEQLIATDIRMWSVLNQPMVDWAVRIHKSGLKAGILSNIGFELARPLSQLDWVRPFTHNTWSCDLRLAKPDPAIYHHVLNAIQVPADQVLFLDDKRENTLSAQAVGLQTVLFRDVEQLQKELVARELATQLPPLHSTVTTSYQAM